MKRVTVVTSKRRRQVEREMMVLVVRLSAKSGMI